MTEELHSIDRLVNIIRRLRSPDGCPWDRKQTHETLKRFLIEESAELLDAIDANDPENMKEELGDVLLQLVLHAQIADEKEMFNFYDVAETISDKMERRHPHVFGNVEKQDEAEQVIQLWEDIKKDEKAKRGQKKHRESVLDGTPKNLPALERATSIQKKAAKVGFDWRSQEEILCKIDEEISELKEAVGSGSNECINEEIGDLLFSIVNLARFRNIGSPEELLQKTIDKFMNRFYFIEDSLKLQGKKFSECNIDDLEALWQKAKKPRCVDA